LLTSNTCDLCLLCLVLCTPVSELKYMRLILADMRGFFYRKMFFSCYDVLRLRLTDTLLSELWNVESICFDEYLEECSRFCDCFKKTGFCIELRVEPRLKERSRLFCCSSFSDLLLCCGLYCLTPLERCLFPMKKTASLDCV